MGCVHSRCNNVCHRMSPIGVVKCQNCDHRYQRGDQIQTLYSKRAGRAETATALTWAVEAPAA